MNATDLPDDLFRIDRVAGSGGMGTVYRATDLRTGRPVALKVLRSTAAPDQARFRREARVLGELDHPRLVRYVGHGVTARGRAWLAMEWLEGETLAQRLARRLLPPSEAVPFAQLLVGALAATHRRGVVHRDLKPSNVFLIGADFRDPKIIDFGIARAPFSDATITRSGVVVGTPGYMSPEQACGEPDLDARSDVFSLACVLYRALVGRAPFDGDDLVAVLAKTVVEQAPALRAGGILVSSEFDVLLADMLAKEPHGRPRDASVVLERLLAMRDAAASPVSAAAVSALGAEERRLACIVLARSVGELRAASGLHGGDVLRETVARHHGRLHPLADGSLAVTVSGAGAATDEAAHAARCALALRALWPDAAIALVTGEALVAGRTPLGEVIDRGAALLEDASGIRVDEPTAALLSARFEVKREGVRLWLRGESQIQTSPRTLLGRPTPCVGRDRDLSWLEAAFRECVSDGVARVVLVTAPAGVGKSRLRSELLARVMAAPHGRAQVWIGCGEPVGSGSPFGVIAQPIRRTANILGHEPPEVQRAKLSARIAERVPREHARRISEFVGELIGVPFPAEASVQLRAARADLTLLGDQMRRAWEDWLAAETAVEPLLLVLEDLHWGDGPSVRLVDAALRYLRDRPLMVLALARPEVDDVLPRLWVDRGVDVLRLSNLGRRASQTLVRAVLGDAPSAAEVERIVERAAGNAFLLEELVRAHAEGDTDRPPASAIAMIQARLEALPAIARRALRAASVFGDVFWRGGSIALSGDDVAGASFDGSMERLAREELVVRRTNQRLPLEEEEWGFRHGLVREAAYAMLTERDRVRGHRLAARWLSEHGETNASVLAEHLERGECFAAAAECYCRAAEQALGGNDFRAALAAAQRGLSLARQPPNGEAAEGDTVAAAVVGTLALSIAEARRWLGDIPGALESAREAMTSLPRGESAWYAAAGEVATGSAALGDADALVELAGLLCDSIEQGPTADAVIALARTAVQLAVVGRRALAAELLASLARTAPESLRRDARVAARIHQAAAIDAYCGGELESYLAHTEAAASAFEQVGDLRNACLQHGNVGHAYAEFGDYVTSEAFLRAAEATGERLGLRNIALVARCNLGRTLAHLGRHAEAEATGRGVIDAFAEQRDARMEAAARVHLAETLALAGELERAEMEVTIAVERARSLAPMHCLALAVLARVRAARGAHPAALEAAVASIELLDAGAGIEGNEAIALLAHIEALAGSGRVEQARSAAARALDRLNRRALRIRRLDLRQSFLEAVPENARTRQLASELGERHA